MAIKSEKLRKRLLAKLRAAKEEEQMKEELLRKFYEKFLRMDDDDEDYDCDDDDDYEYDDEDEED